MPVRPDRTIQHLNLERFIRDAVGTMNREGKEARGDARYLVVWVKQLASND
jgi:hypothetical protein